MWRGRKQNKYRNIKCEADGLKFDSKREMARYHELKLMEKQGLISKLQVHPVYPLVMPDGKPLIIKGDKRNTKVIYRPDFDYICPQRGLVVEDVKGRHTASEYSFKLKRAIFEALYQVDITIVL